MSDFDIYEFECAKCQSQMKYPGFYARWWSTDPSIPRLCESCYNTVIVESFCDGGVTTSSQMMHKYGKITARGRRP